MTFPLGQHQGVVAGCIEHEKEKVAEIQLHGHQLPTSHHESIY